MLFFAFTFKDFVPRFIQEDSMQVFGNIPNALSYTKISMWFKPEKPDGLLIYRGSQVKDFLSILIRDFYVIFCFNLGSGSAIIKTTKRFQLHTWISIEARQDQSIGSLKMNDDNPVYGKSLGKFNELNLDSELYLGGYEDVTKIFVDVGIVTSFSGCVSELILNNRRIEFGMHNYFKLKKKKKDFKIKTIRNILFLSFANLSKSLLKSKRSTC